MRDRLLVTVCAIIFVATGHHASSAAGATCESLATLSLPEATITSATAVPAGPTKVQLKLLLLVSESK